MAMHKDSCLCVDSSLDLFSIPPTDAISRESFYSKIYPVGSIGQGGPLEFTLKSNKADFIDLRQSFLALTLKILKGDGSAPTAPGNDGVIAAISKVFPTNYLSGAMFKDVELYIGNKLISSSDSHYGYKAMIETLLTYGNQIHQSWGELEGFYKDDRDFEEVSDFDATHNSGARKRFLKTQYGKSFQLITKIHNDIFNQGKKFPGDIPMKVRFIRNDESFCLMAKSNDVHYKIEIEEAVLYVKRVTLEDTFLLELDRTRATGKLMKYPFKRVELKYSTQAPNKAILQENRVISNSELPKRIIVGLVDSRAWDGHLNYNPFNFGVTDVVLQRGKDVSAFCELSKIDYAGDKFGEVYTALMYATGRLFTNDAPSISPSDFKHGNALYCFDLSKNTPNANTFELTESGTINLIITLKAPVAHGIVIVLYIEFDSLLGLGPSNQAEVISSQI